MRHHPVEPTDPPSGSAYDADEWRRWLPLARSLRAEGEPALVPEARGRISIEWVVEPRKPVRPWRLTVLDPGASTLPVMVERHVRSGFEERVYGVPYAVVPLVAVVFALLLWATHAAYMGRILLAAACAVASLLAAPLVWRHRRVWRTLDLAREPAEVVDAAEALLVQHLTAERADDQEALRSLEQELWEAAALAQPSAEASSVRARTPSLA